MVSEVSEMAGGEARMTEAEEVRSILDERGIKYEEIQTGEGGATFLIDYCERCGDYLKRISVWSTYIEAERRYATPEQAIVATVGYREQAEWDEWLEDHNGVHEWHSPRVHPPKVIELHFSDGITRFVPEDAATVGEEHEMHICKRCGVAYELNIIDKGFGKPRFCPNCGYRRSIND